MLATLLLALVSGREPTLGQDGQASARWRCDPATVEVGEPFELVLELEHPATTSGRTLIAGELVLDDTWLVLARERVHSVPAGAADTLRTTQAWNLVSLEPGSRSLAEAAAALPLAGSVTKIQVGEARVEVRGVLAEGEDVPRPLAEFPEGFARLDASRTSARNAWLAAALGAVLALGAGLWFWLRRRARRVAPVRPASPVERLDELEGWSEGEKSRECCYELTHLLRAATDRARNKNRAGLTDEQWLAELGTSPDVPHGAVTELTAIFERAARVKYAGDHATPWALKETIAKARVVLQAVGAGGAQP